MTTMDPSGILDISKALYPKCHLDPQTSLLPAALIQMEEFLSHLNVPAFDNDTQSDHDGITGPEYLVVALRAIFTQLELPLGPQGILAGTEWHEHLEPLPLQMVLRMQKILEKHCGLAVTVGVDHKVRLLTVQFKRRKQGCECVLENLN